MGGCGAGWRVRTTFLGAVRSPSGAVPVFARGLRHMAPTYYITEPGSPSDRPSRLRALFFRGPLFRSATSQFAPDQRRSESGPAPRGARPAGGGRARPPARPLSRRLADEGLRLARLSAPKPSPPFMPFATSRTRSSSLRTPPAPPRDSRPRSPVVAARGSPLVFSLMAAGRSDPGGARCRFAEPAERGARRSIPDLLFCAARLLRPARPPHRATAPGHYDRTLAGLRAIMAVHAVGVAFGVCSRSRRGAV